MKSNLDRLPASPLGLKKPSPVLGFSDSVSLGVGKIFAQKRGEPIVTSLLDTDFYKFPMNQLQRAWLSPEEQARYGGRETWGETEVTFSWINRHADTIKPHEVIDINELKEQLEAARELRFAPAELAYLRGMPINPQMTRRMFSGWFVKDLANFQLPEFDLGTNPDGSFKLDFNGRWDEVTYWEIIAMSIVMEMYLYGVLQQNEVSDARISALLGGLLQRLEVMCETIAAEPGVSVAEFGTRRRLSRNWQSLAYAYAKDRLGDSVVGSSNVKLSMELGSDNPIGTNAHELPMVVANLGNDSDAYLLDSQYRVLERWVQMYPELKVYLPDTFGTKQFHVNAPAWLDLPSWSGPRIDSMPEKQAMAFMQEWWQQQGIDPVRDGKLIMPSDGLTPQRLVDNVRELADQVARLPQAMGTNFTNDTKGLMPSVPEFRAFSQVCKVTQANGRSAVKLSDNPAKAIGDPDRVARFKQVFGTDGFADQKVEV